MSFFVTATQAMKPKSKDIRTLSLAFAAVLMLMAVAQLFSFERFPDVMAAMWLPGGDKAAHVYPAFIVTFEVLALPFLLLMRLSPLMRFVSMVCGWLAVAFWLYVSLWQNLTTNVIGNSGFLGATISLPVGWWEVLISIALGVLAVWVSWGIWPLSRKKD